MTRMIGGDKARPKFFFIQITGKRQGMVEAGRGTHGPPAGQKRKISQRFFPINSELLLFSSYSLIKNYSHVH